MAESASLNSVTQRAFLAYERVRKSGVTNMYSREVQDLADITEEVHVLILKHYATLAKAWLTPQENI